MTVGTAFLPVLLLLAAAAPPAPNTAVHTPPVAAARLVGLDRAQADRLLGQLARLQTRMIAGERVHGLTILAGAPASWPMVTVSPRHIFLNMRFQDALSIEQVPPTNPLAMRYRFAILPDGPGRPVWTADVVVGPTGNVERVTMVYEPPAPF